MAQLHDRSALVVSGPSEAGLNVTSARYSLMTVNTSGHFARATAATDPIAGALSTLSVSAGAGEDVGVISVGKSKLKVDGSSDAIAIGDDLAPSTDAGVAIKGTRAVNSRCVALEAATTATEINVRFI